MIAAAVQFYDVVVWLHVSAVVTAFGPTFAFGLYGAIIGRNFPRSIPAMIAAQETVMRTIVTISMVVVLASGIYLAADRSLFSEAFVGVGIVAILILFGLVHGFFIPNGRREKELAERDIKSAGDGEVKFSDEFFAKVAREARMGPIAGLIVILTIYFMVVKPFA